MYNINESKKETEKKKSKNYDLFQSTFEIVF